MNALLSYSLPRWTWSLSNPESGNKIFPYIAFIRFPVHKTREVTNTDYQYQEVGHWFINLTWQFTGSWKWSTGEMLKRLDLHAGGTLECFKQMCGYTNRPFWWGLKRLACQDQHRQQRPHLMQFQRYRLQSSGSQRVGQDPFGSKERVIKDH